MAGWADTVPPSPRIDALKEALRQRKTGAPAEHVLQRLADTDLWYRTYRFRDDARFMYMLSIGDVLRAKGYQTIYREFNETHAYPCWRAGLADALLALLSD